MRGRASHSEGRTAQRLQVVEATRLRLDVRSHAEAAGSQHNLQTRRKVSKSAHTRKQREDRSVANHRYLLSKSAHTRKQREDPQPLLKGKRHSRSPLTRGSSGKMLGDYHAPHSLRRSPLTRGSSGKLATANLWRKPFLPGLIQTPELAVTIGTTIFVPTRINAYEFIIQSTL
jgi:hypothetical protein